MNIRHRHQAIAVKPIVFRGMFYVSFPQVLQGEPWPPLLPLFPRLIIMGPCC